MKAARTILIAEDEADIRELIAFNLERESYVCRCAADGHHAIAELDTQVPDLVILDRMLPGASGDEVLTRMRHDPRTSAVPVIMLTAKADESDELVGFAIGADDYVTKPFSIKALVARVGALLRRAQGSTDDASTGIVRSGPVTLDPERQTVDVAGAAIMLTLTEFRVLQTLVVADGRLRSRDQLIDAALGMHVAVTDRTIDVHVAALRKKLGTAARWIQTIRGAGYAWRRPTEAQ